VDSPTLTETSTCVAGSTRVRLESGAVVRVSELSVGDRVQTRNGFEPVEFFLHKLPDSDAPRPCYRACVSAI
jgi:hypothetical protein